MDRVMKSLKIDAKATELIAMITFLFPTNGEKERLIHECAEMNMKDINKYVFEYRKQKIKSTMYFSITEFNEYWNESRKKALERLFQEPLHESKLRKMNIDHSERIFQIHSKQPCDIRFMKFLLYL